VNLVKMFSGVQKCFCQSKFKGLFPIILGRSEMKKNRRDFHTKNFFPSISSEQLSETERFFSLFATPKSQKHGNESF
jgi:hypothetical protein